MWRNFLLQGHLENCRFKPIDCKYKTYGCKVRRPAGEIDKHIAECQYRLVKCSHCPEYLPLALKQVCCVQELLI